MYSLTSVIVICFFVFLGGIEVGIRLTKRRVLLLSIKAAEKIKELMDEAIKEELERRK